MSLVSKPKVLVADDDITVRMIARESLEQAGFFVVEAEDGLAALEVYKNVQPEVVVLDVIMPKMDGYEVCRQLREMPGSENLSILMMTALDDVESIHAAYDAGASEFTTKPVNWTIEEHRLRNMLRASATAKQVFLSKQEWERTFNVLDEMVVIQDTELNIIQANVAAEMASSRGGAESIIDTHCTVSLPCAGEGLCLRCPVQEVLATGKKKVFDRVNEELERTCQVSIFPVFDDVGTLSRVVHMVKDISDQQRMESEIRRAQKMEAVGTLAGGLAHDFNNLLQAISAYAELVRLEFTPDQQSHKDLQQISKAVKRGTAITRQMLAVSRKTESKKEPLLLNKSMSDVAELLKPALSKQVSIELLCAEDLWMINADASQMEQVLMNLGVNAKHAMPSGGVLTFSAENAELDKAFCRGHKDMEPGSYVRLLVRDTGCGMGSETMVHIFEPFFTTRSPGKGTGLGLSMVYGIIQEHGGHVLCSSEIGEGTTFEILFPALGTGASKEPLLSESKVMNIMGSETILLAEDDDGIRNFVSRVLEASGYCVLTGVNGQDALGLYKENSEAVSIAVLDQNMPEMNGIELLDHLHEHNPQLPVLLSSGCELNDVVKKGDSRVQYIRKPYESVELLQRIRLMLDRGVS